MIGSGPRPTTPGGWVVGCLGGLPRLYLPIYALFRSVEALILLPPNLPP